MKRLLSLLLAALMLLSLAACKKEETDTTQAEADADSDATAVFFESEHYTVTTAEFQYFLAKVYDDFAAQYGDMISYMLDTTSPLRSQSCPVDSTGEMSWFDYFADGAMETVEDYILLAEEAHAVGFEISEEDKALIDAELAAIDTAAAEAGYTSTQDYISDCYGSMCTKESLYNCFILYYLANTYRAELYEGYRFTEEEYLSYANENKGSCYYADFMYMNISADIAEDATEEEKAAEWEKTRQTAIAFNNAVSGKDSFIEQAEKYLRSVCTIVETEEDSDSATYKLTEEQLIESAKGAETIGVAYSTGADNVDWIFAEGRLAGEQTVIENEEEYTCEIIYMLKPMYLSEAPTVDIRHILITPDDEGDDFKAAEKATALYEEWLEAGGDEDTFSRMAMENSADTGSVSTGGLYASVVPGQMVTEFNDWCFDESRQSGDSDIVKTDYGYHIMYFVEHGMPRWKDSADTALRDAKATAFVDSLSDKHSFLRNDDNVDKCPDLFGE